MGRYIDEILQPGERLLYSTTIHWIIYLPGLALWVLALAVIVFGNAVAPGIGGVGLIIIALILLGIGLISVLRAWFRRWTTEFDVTDRRIVQKNGFIERRTVEMNMDKVESVDVNQSILGRIFDYGEVIVRGTGESWEPIRTIGSPLKFRNHITAR
jgi:uncharacterized membrane protein YdbT with pleckstrin-like domain